MTKSKYLQEAEEQYGTSTPYSTAKSGGSYADHVHGEVQYPASKCPFQGIPTSPCYVSFTSWDS